MPTHHSAMSTSHGWQSKMASRFTLWAWLALACVAGADPPATFIFGDSLVDAGNNNYIVTLSRANYLPNGIDFDGHQPTGRYTNGRTIVDILGQEMGLGGFVPPYMDPNTTGDVLFRGVNYASGGGGILNQTGSIFTSGKLESPLQLIWNGFGTGWAHKPGCPDRQLRQQQAGHDRAARGGGGGEPAEGRALLGHHGLQRLHQQLPGPHPVRAGARRDAPGGLHQRHDRQVPAAAHQAVPSGRPQGRGGERGADRLHPVPEGHHGDGRPVVGRRGVRRVPEPAGAVLQPQAARPGERAKRQPRRLALPLRRRLPHRLRHHRQLQIPRIRGGRLGVLLRGRAVRGAGAVRADVEVLRGQVQVRVLGRLPPQRRR
ncbi:uncharacterized protein LOC100823342 isoform X2 [Brachypodium distachyon]|uniref:uncharacterized protein LOC100823342 isoform X2 n=1 Tax=Brachypodium distachyon TaxID=15368 RepID=UPI000D0D68C5|nr:uncharacterized protein LOC100823342 isoform X2 [Brachypodium distachyon]|eukprot:XP_024313124.1 uncharacterized protein LOC100823342 isoform X2 [Brachypodium distachyon]